MQMSLDKLKGLGWRPFAVGMSAAAVVASVGAVAATVAGRSEQQRHEW